jgi:hypothetical protein
LRRALACSTKINGKHTTKAMASIQQIKFDLRANNQWFRGNGVVFVWGRF